MKSTKQDIIYYAETLYCSYNPDGERTYTLREISKLVEKKFNKSTHYSTIKNWADKFGWDKLNARIKQQSIEKAKDLPEPKMSLTEKLIEVESDKLAKDYKNAENMANIGYNVINKAYKGEKAKFINVKDAISLVKLGSDIKFRIQGLPEQNEKEINININQFSEAEKAELLKASRKYREED